MARAFQPSSEETMAPQPCSGSVLSHYAIYKITLLGPRCKNEVSFVPYGTIAYAMLLEAPCPVALADIYFAGHPASPITAA